MGLACWCEANHSQMDSGAALITEPAVAFIDSTSLGVEVLPPVDTGAPYGHLSPA
jgi:hypothetical protein